MIRNLLRKIAMPSPSPAVAASADDQTYSEAQMDNAIVDSGLIIEKLCTTAALGSRANDMLRQGINRLKLSSADTAAHGHALD